MPGSFQTSNPGGVSSTGSLPGVRSFTASAPRGGTVLRAAFGCLSGLMTTSTTSTITRVSGLGFQPRAIILYAVNRTTESTGTNASGGMTSGYSDGTHHAWSGWCGADAVATTQTGMNISITKAVAILNDGSAAITNQAFATFEDDSFFLTWDTIPSVAYLIGYLVIGGTDITNTFVGNDLTPLATGNKSITNVGFQGDFAMFLMVHRNTPGGGGHGVYSAGTALSSTKQWAVGVGSTQTAISVAANINAGCQLDSNACMMMFHNTDGTVDVKSDFTQFTSSGFDLNFSNITGSAFVFTYLVIKGGRWANGVQAKPSTATTQTVTGLSFQPKALGLMTTAATVDNTITNPASVAIGTATGSSAQSSLFLDHNDNLNTVVTQAITSANCLDIGTPLCTAAFTSFNADGWTSTWAQTGSANLVGWFALAGNTTAAAPPSSTNQNLLMLMGWGT